MLNSIGLQTSGVEAFVGDKLPFFRENKVPCMVKVAGSSVEEDVEVSVIGMGGITTASDAVQFFLAGATATAVGTVTLYDWAAAVIISDGILEHVSAHGIEDMHDLIGRLQSCPDCWPSHTWAIAH